MSILSSTDQTVRDLLRGWQVCFVDDDIHLHLGAEQMELRCAADVVQLAAAVAIRLTRFGSRAARR